MQKAETTVIPKMWTTFPEAIRIRLGREAGPQRAMLEEGHLLIILHHLPKPDEHKRRPALFWRQPSGEWKTTSDGIGVMAIQDLLKSYDDKLSALEDAENAANDARTYHSVLEELGPVLRSSRGLHRALQQARDLLKVDRDLINCRDAAASVERNAELLLQDAQFGLDFVVAKQAEAQAVVAKSQAAAAHRLNLLAALFLPLSTLASLYGMSLKVPGSEHPQAFWMVCGVGVLLGGVLSGMLLSHKQ